MSTLSPNYLDVAPLRMFVPLMLRVPWRVRVMQSLLDKVDLHDENPGHTVDLKLPARAEANHVTVLRPNHGPRMRCCIRSSFGICPIVYHLPSPQMRGVLVRA